MKYQRKQAAVQAVQFLDDDNTTLCAIRDIGVKLTVHYHPFELEINIDAPQGTFAPRGRLFVKRGDYIVKAESSEIYSCTPEVFRRDYEKV